MKSKNDQRIYCGSLQGIEKGDSYVYESPFYIWEQKLISAKKLAI